MSKKVIAEIRLANGEVGYYDDYSKIHLTISKPNALVYAGTNCSQIKKSIKSGRLRLVSGSFETPVVEEVTTVVAVPAENKEEVIKDAPAKKEEVIEENKEVVAEEVVAPTIEEVKEEVVNEVIEEVTEKAAAELEEKVVEVEVQEDGLQEEKSNKKKKKMR